MDDLDVDFFLDFDAVLTVGKRIIEEAEGHLILLNDNTETYLSVASLLDGNTIDFLFGVKTTQTRAARAKANNVKKFMRTLDDHGQRSVAMFYCSVFQMIVRYHKDMNQPCSCCWNISPRNKFCNDVGEAFECLQSMITANNFLPDE